MKGWPMYTEIQHRKDLGYGKHQVAKQLGINFRTVSRYWDMEPEAFEQAILARKRKHCLELYEGIVLDWLKQQPGLSAAEVLDRLKEHYQVQVGERSVRRLTTKLRQRHGIPKCSEKIRQYMAVDDPPMGRQMQVDLGMAHVIDSHTLRYRKMYCVACVLSHSRYKWGVWRTEALNSAQLVSALEECFEFLGGMPAELVFDQDRLLAVGENYGDIIYTKEFEQFRQRMGFSVYLCRASDPESKGKVEAAVKYFKRGFARHRKFFMIDPWNDDFLAWLDRTGNAKEHGTTKKVPAEVFHQEQLFLKPVPCPRRILTPVLIRSVHKNNTVFYKGCRYSLPLGTYYPGREAVLEETDGILRISDLIDPVVLAEHAVSREKGRLIKNPNHGRDYSVPLADMENKLLGKMETSDEAGMFLQRIRQFKARYVRDQFQLIGWTVAQSEERVWKKALSYCISNSLFSATEFRDAAQYFEQQLEAEEQALLRNPKVVVLQTVPTQKRPLSEYAALLKGGESQ